MNGRKLFIQHFLKSILLWTIGGIIYTLIEILWRGYSHWSMFIVGGLCFLEIGAINEYLSEDLPIEFQAMIGALGITATELISGIIINIVLGWNVWDYSNLPLNILGQICLPYTILWWFVSLFGIYIDDIIRENVFYEKPVSYTFVYIDKIIVWMTSFLEPEIKIIRRVIFYIKNKIGKRE